MNAREPSVARWRRRASLFACVVLSWVLAVLALMAMLQVVPVTRGDQPDHIE